MEKTIYDDGGIVWLDMEMTGLDIVVHQIIEISCVVTDKNLENQIEGPTIVIHLSDKNCELSSEWVKKNFGGKGGLLNLAKKSNISCQEAEIKIVKFMQSCFKTTNPILGGASPSKDRQFLEKHMPNLNSLISYRTLDVSTLKECIDRWMPGSVSFSAEDSVHRALDDIKKTIFEAGLVKEKIFRRQSPIEK
eukprot:GHVP01041280.1.p2 GENE.GHVP01041280.1~~GHVP01041280.1.p2  ORF type:complete len:192 (-),score=37.82 GHVP01041280.1:101-676(-)